MLGKEKRRSTTVTIKTAVDVACNEDFEFELTYENRKLKGVELVPKDKKLHKKAIDVFQRKSDYREYIYWYLLTPEQYEELITTPYGYQDEIGIIEIRHKLKTEEQIQELADNEDLIVLGYNSSNGFWINTSCELIPFAVQAVFGSKHWDLKKVRKHLGNLGVIKEQQDIQINPVWQNQDISGHHEYKPVIIVNQKTLDGALKVINKTKETYWTVRLHDFFKGGFAGYLLEKYDPFGLLPFFKEDEDDEY